jgi:ADP-L-glycero-D-manno-heptose 6-epimerase
MPKELKDKYQYFTQADLTKLRSVGYREPFRLVKQGVFEYVEYFLKKTAYR